MTRSPRELAFQILLKNARDPSQSIESHLYASLKSSGSNADERRWIMELVYGVTRNQRLLDHWIDSGYKGPYRKAQHAIKVLLRIGVFQLKMMNTADHAALNETVNLSRKVRQSGSSGLINAVLRKVQATSLEQLLSGIHDPLDRLAIQTSHPDWLIRRWVSRYTPETVSLFCSRNNLPPRVWVRRNALYIDGEAFESLLKREDIGFQRSDVLENFYQLDRMADLISTPEFKAGWFSFQDLAAGLVAHLVTAEAGHIIVDACAAPGGKMAFMAERYGKNARIIACDVSPSRLLQVQENVDRLHLPNVEVKQLDATRDALPSAHRILLDVPCSGTGVMGRRADARWKRQESDLQSLAVIQSQILVNSWQALKPDGLLIYATCSLEPEENWELIEKSLELLPGAVIEPVSDEILKPYIDGKGALSTLPWLHDMDGMFAVKIRKS